MSELALLVVGLPLIVATGMVLLRRWISARIVYWLRLIALGLTGAGLLALLPYADGPPLLSLAWLPGTGQMGLRAGTTGLYAALATTSAAFFVLLATPPCGGADDSLSAALMMLGASGANVAFLADHFLARYVALEIVALCVALAPLVELGGGRGGPLARLIYLVLRLGDAGLLVAILILADVAGTLEIVPALGAGPELVGIRQGWVVGGFLLAVWVKLGAWPFHAWLRLGAPLSVESRAWLYATLLPNLGIYLLYRVTPLLGLSGGWQMGVLWLGGSVAGLGLLLALLRQDPRQTLVSAGAAHGGLLFLAAAAGLKSAVWLGLLVTTPLRILLFLSSDTGRRARTVVLRRIAGALFGLGGLALTGFDLLLVWWGSMEGAPPIPAFLGALAAALLGLWVAGESARIYRGAPSASARSSSRAIAPQRWVILGGLGLGVLGGAVTFEPLARWLMANAELSLPGLPSLWTLLRAGPVVPALLAGGVLALLARWVRRERGVRRAPRATYDPLEGILRVARAVRGVIEVGILDRAVAISVRLVVGGARTTYRLVEQEGLEGLLRRIAEGVVGLSLRLKRRHTGLLRRNLMWVPISLALAILAALTYR